MSNQYKLARNILSFTEALPLYDIFILLQLLTFIRGLGFTFKFIKLYQKF